jgi:toxin ParE1/3/4
MARYKLSKAASNDLANLYESTILNFGITQARKYYAGLLAKFKTLSENPLAYRQRQEISPPVRACPYEAHIILYAVNNDNGIEVIRVRHAREDWG